MSKLPPERSKARAEEKAQQREQAELAAQNPRPLEVDAAAIERRTEICAQLLKYYEFLIALYLPEAALKRPPEEGWSFVNAERFAFLNKTDTVIDLYKHLPYISQDEDESYKIHYRTTAVDYTGRHFKEHRWRRQNPVNEPPQYYEQMDGEQTWPGSLDDPQHIAVLAQTMEDFDWYILLDTRSGKIARVCPRDRQENVRTLVYSDIHNLTEKLMDSFHKLDVAPVTSTDVHDFRDQGSTYLTEGDVAKIKALFYQHGWFSADYDKETCMREVQEVLDAFRQE